MPPWVMVPVPEDHVIEVMEFIVRTIARSSLEDWDAESFDGFWHEADEAGRSLLSVVAKGVLTGKDVTDQVAADFLQLSPRETGTVVRDLNEAARAANRPNVLSVATVTESLPNGRPWEKRVLVMTPEYAELVRDVARAERTSAAG